MRERMNDNDKKELTWIPTRGHSGRGTEGSPSRAGSAESLGLMKDCFRNTLNLLKYNYSG